MNLLLVIAAAPLAASGYSSLSSFAGTARLSHQLLSAPSSPSFGRRRGGSRRQRQHATITMYESSHDPPSSPSFNAWSVLAKTERWISETLASTNDGMKKSQQQQPQQQQQQRSSSSQQQHQPQSPPSAGGGNPYTRKEVEYACENAQEASMITALVFRRLREFREIGERHGAAQEELRRAEGQYGNNAHPCVCCRHDKTRFRGGGSLRSAVMFAHVCLLW
jgi:hypothetical protein